METFNFIPSLWAQVVLEEFFREIATKNRRRPKKQSHRRMAVYAKRYL